MEREAVRKLVQDNFKQQQTLNIYDLSTSSTIQVAS